MKATIALFGSLVLCLASVVIPAAEASATTSTMAVTPSTALVDGQSVTVAGNGFAPTTTFFFCEGRSVANPATTDCGKVIGAATTDRSGNFTTTYAVQRFIDTTSAGTLDCAQPGLACAILGTDNISGGKIAVTPITFIQQPPVTYSIHGVVSNGNTLQPVPGVKVWVYKPSDGYVGSLQATTGADGSYVISNPTPGVQYKMLFISPDPNLASAWHANENNRGTADAVVLRPGVDESPEIDALLFTPGSVSGTVTDGSGRPVAGVLVGLYFGGGNGYLPTFSTTTGASGTYTVSGVQQNTYQVLFRAPSGSGLATEWYDNAPTRRAATGVGIDSGTHVTGINAQLAPSS